jgi:hypothetical protein
MQYNDNDPQHINKNPALIIMTQKLTSEDAYTIEEA